MIGKIIRIRKIKRPLRKGWNLRSTVSFAESIPPIRKQSNEKLSGRKLDFNLKIQCRKGSVSGEDIYSPSYWLARIQFIRPVALIGRASDSKSEGWGFESLLACINLFEDYVFKSCRVSG